MNGKILITLSVFFGLLQGPLLPSVFMEGILLAMYLSANKGTGSVPSVFLSGLLFDLLGSQHLGTTSVVFLATLLIVSFLQEHLPVHKPVSLGIIALLVNLTRAKIIFPSLTLFSVALTTVVALLIFTSLVLPAKGWFKFKLTR